MKIEEILQLGKMGYTKEEIQQMETGSQEQKAADPEPDPAEQEPKQEPASKEPAAAAPAAQDDKPEVKPDPAIMQRMDSIEKQLQALVRTMQAENVKKDSFGNPAENIEQQADKALAALIQPHETE